MIIDAHLHIDGYNDAQLVKVLLECQQLNIGLMNVSMDIETYLIGEKLAQKYDFIKTSFGVHPWRASKYVNNLGVLDKYLKSSVMIGEIGLDKKFFDYADPYQHQLQVFEYILASEHTKSKLLNLHTSGAEQEVLDFLIKYNHHNFIVHWYNGSLGLIEKYLKQGGYFTIGVEILFNPKIETIAKKIPLNRVLLETDNPTAWPWLKKEPEQNAGMPNLLFDILARLARIKAVSEEECYKQIEKNQRFCFCDNL